VETTPGRTAELRTPWSADELRTGYCVHFAFEVPSLDTYRDIFAGSGIAPVGGPRIRADNVEQITSPTLTDTSSSSSAGSTSQSPISAEPSWQPAVKVSPSRPTPDAETTSAYRAELLASMSGSIVNLPTVGALQATSDLQEQSRPVDRRLSCCLHVTSVLILVCWPVP
jgi:hypothetical protein